MCVGFVCRVSLAPSVKYLAFKESAFRELVDLLVRDRSIGAVKVSGLRAVSSDPLRRHFSE